MVTTLETEGKAVLISPDEFADSLHEEGLGYKKDILFNGINWRIYSSFKKPSRILRGTSELLAVDALSSLSKLSRVDYASNGQGNGHLEAMNFLLAKWPEVLPIIAASEPSLDTDSGNLEKQIFPEVFLPLPVFTHFFEKTGRNLDCVANDSVGNFYIIEIGKGHKGDQLEKQLYLARNLFPSVSFTGVVAKYASYNKSNRRMHFMFS